METIRREDVKSVHGTQQAFRKMLIEKRGCACVGCKRDFSDKKSLLHMEHIIPIAVGGEQYTEGNVQILCYKCHAEKTKLDATLISLLKRIGIVERNGAYEWIIYPKKEDAIATYLYLKQKNLEAKTDKEKNNAW